MPCFLSIPFSKSGPFPRPALPGVSSTTGLSATLPARTGPRGFPVGACTPPTELPVLLRLPSCRHAGATTPAGTIRCVCRLLPEPPSAFPYNTEGRLPHCAFRGLLGVHFAFRPVCSLNRPRRPFGTRVLQSISLPPRTALAATNRSDNFWVGFAPTRKTRLPRRTGNRG